MLRGKKRIIRKKTKKGEAVRKRGIEKQRGQDNPEVYQGIQRLEGTWHNCVSIHWKIIYHFPIKTSLNRICAK